MARINGRVDRNQPEVVAALRAFGAGVIVISNVKNAFDILVAYEGHLIPMEIKDGEKTPSQTKLTEGEIKCREMLNAHYVRYNVVYSVRDAIDCCLSYKNH